ncbi:MAG TPA: DUF3575 domain-containing protein [Flavobacteriales bacterium]|nr:DUF3575 domain-containing protein [Flavobacteriales bacterium]
MRYLILACCLLAAFVTKAQDTAGVLSQRLNLVKLGLSSGFASTISLNYERVLNQDISVAMTVSYMLPRRNGGLLDLQTDEIDMSSNRKLSGVFFTPEVKWFLEKSDTRDAPRGFYMGAYGRYSNMRLTAEMSASGEGTDVSGTAYGNLQVDLIEAGLGIDAGYQILALNERLVFDFVFFGPRWSYYTLKVDAEFNGEGELAEDLEQALEDALGRDIVPLNVDVAKSGSSTSGVSSMGYRAGLKIGYAF